MARRLSPEEEARREAWAEEQIAKGNADDFDGFVRAAKEWMDIPPEER